MVLVVDKRVDGRRATHALVIGVSRYRHVEGGSAPTPAGLNSKLQQLSSAARSASEFAAWLMNEYSQPDSPLATLDVCLAPRQNEAIHADVAARMGGSLDATRDTVMDAWISFRDRCLGSPDDVAIVYVAGHGVQLTKRGATLLLEDYGAPRQPSELYAALDMVGLHESLNTKAAAAQQFWFVDTCRQQPAVARRFESLQGAFRDDERSGQCRSSPLFLASAPRGNAWARIGGVSLFNEVLLAGLRGHAAVGPPKKNELWRVSIGSLTSYLVSQVKVASRILEEEQLAELAGRPGTTDEAIQYFSTPPSTKITIDVTPIAARSCASGTLSFEGKPIRIAPEWPFCDSVPAGLYLLTIAAKAPFKDAHHPLDVKPPELEHFLEVQQ